MVLLSGKPDGDGAAFTPSAGQLSVSCGCSVAPSQSSTLTSPRSLNTAGPTCGDGEAFVVESDTFPVTQGCYLDTMEVSNGYPIYTASGAMNLGQVWVVAAEYTDEEENVSVSCRYIRVAFREQVGGGGRSARGGESSSAVFVTHVGCERRAR